MAQKKLDYILLGTVALILFIGLGALLSASIAQSQKEFGDIYAYFRHQLIFGVGLGLLLLFATYRISYKRWKGLAFPFLLASIFLLILVFIPDISLEIGGARRWLKIADFSFQPSELAKLGFVIYLAAWLDARYTVTKKWSEGFIPFTIVVGVLSVLIALQPDVGTLGVVALTAAFMYFVGGAGILQMGTIFLSGIGLFVFLIKTAPYRFDRVVAFLNNSVDPQGVSYQINQALLAIGSGGVLGVGLGKGLQKYNLLPEPMKDSIFAVWSEEAGFIGGVALIALFTLFCFRGFKVAKKSQDRFGRMLALGITFWIVLQALTNISAMLGLIPLTGIPLPLVSYGGSSMVVTLAGIGILLNISKHK